MVVYYVPLARNSKQPLAGDDWHKRMSTNPDVINAWISLGYNLGMAVEESGRVVVDWDTGLTAAREFYRKYPLLCTVLCLTRRGIHMHFAGRTKTRRFAHGDIKGNGYVLVPPSRIDGFEYEWISNGELQLFPEALFPRKEVLSSEIKNARRYIDKIVAVAGQHGHNSTYRAACKLRDAGWTEAQALAALMEWNETNAEPKWSVKELLHKVQSAYAKERRI